MNILHVVKSDVDFDDNLRKLSDIQSVKLKYRVSIMKNKKALIIASIRKLIGRPFDAIHVHIGTTKFNGLSNHVTNQDISLYFSQKEFYLDSEYQLLLNKEILFSYSEGNHKLVISVIESVKYLPSEYTLRIIGEIVEEDMVAYREIITNLNLKHRISFGLVNETITNKGLSKAYKESSLVVFNSIGINIKANLVKVLACGVPAFAFSSEEYLELKGLSFSGILGPKALARKFRDIVEDDNWVDVETVYNQYSIESLALTLDRKYKGLNNN